MHYHHPPKPVSYLAIGDSLTEGIGANSPDHHFVAQFFRYLQHSDNCHHRNWGLSGMTSSELLHFVQNPALQRLLPRVTHLTLTTGGCDFIRLYDQGKLSLKEVLKASRKIQKNVREIFTLIRNKNPDLTVYLLGFYIPLPAYEIGIEPAKIMVQTLNRLYTRLCHTFGVHLINPYHCFLNRTEYFCDEVHPNQLGYDQLAQLFIQSVEQSSQPVF